MKIVKKKVKNPKEGAKLTKTVEKVIIWAVVEDFEEALQNVIECLLEQLRWQPGTDASTILIQLLWDKGGGTTKMALKFPQLPAANSIDNVWFVAHAEGGDDDFEMYTKVFKPIFDVINRINAGISELSITGETRVIELPPYFQNKVTPKTLGPLPNMTRKLKINNSFPPHFCADHSGAICSPNNHSATSKSFIGRVISKRIMGKALVFCTIMLPSYEQCELMFKLGLVSPALPQLKQLSIGVGVFL